MNERQSIAYNLRIEGKTFREIAEVLGVTIERARQIVTDANRKVERLSHWTGGLPKVIALRLQSAGYASKAEVKAAIESGSIEASFRGKRVPWIGEKRLQILMNWLN